jgi:restriction system protein
MLEGHEVDSMLVITDVTVLREQWLHQAARFGLNTARALDGLRVAESISMTIQGLRSPKNESLIAELARHRRWLIIADEPSLQPKAVEAFVDRLLSLNEKSKALFISTTVPESRSFEAEFRFSAEHILGRRIIERPDTEIRLARFAPSLSLLRKLQKHPLDLDDLSWREFERLIATLLEKDGYVVELMRGSKDGGVDVMATKDLGAVGSFKSIWQAKKKGIGSKVGISVVRELADTRNEFGASKGMIVTSTYLTRGALDRIERDKYILGKVDRDDLESWIQRTLFGQ